MPEIEIADEHKELAKLINESKPTKDMQKLSDMIVKIEMLKGRITSYEKALNNEAVSPLWKLIARPELQKMKEELSKLEKEFNTAGECEGRS